jgi:hypothetical protein
MIQALNPKAAEQDALRESTLKGAERILSAAYRALKGPVYLPLRGKARERAWKTEAQTGDFYLNLMPLGVSPRSAPNQFQEPAFSGRQPSRHRYHSSESIALQFIAQKTR